MPVDHHDSSGRSWVLPLFVAAGSVGIGVVLGAFVAVQMLATPVKTDARTQQASLTSKPAPVAAETTGSASSDDGGVGCGGQTWPYLSRNCVQQTEARDAKPGPAPSAQSAISDPQKAEPEPKNLRVVAPDNVDRAAVAAIETKPAAPTKEPAANANQTALAIEATPVAQAAVSTEPAAADVPAAASVATSVPEAAAPLPLAKPHTNSKPVHTAKKVRHKPKIEDEAKPDDQDDNHVASGDDDDQSMVRVERPRRIGGRGYDEEATYDRRDRRVEVIRRDEEPFGGPFGRGGLFGGLFGGF